MANSLFPAYLKINYVSAYAPHVMTIPTLEYAPDTGEFHTHTDGTLMDVASLKTLLFDTIKPIFKSTTEFVDWTVYTLAAPGDPALPVFSESLGIAGTTAVSGWDKAVQWTWSWRTSAFGLFKWVALDAPNADSFDPYRDLTGISAYEDIDAMFTDAVNPFAGRDGGRPATFLQIAITLNEKLRREYRMN